ncbi:mandelate racemase/muconate lactonizing enzyme family protein [Candidatus Bathyarchaeota archaeon]|nr:mandelate racemase/muconate lactonizing enzyme family protein [Candidatus Bathyarchaeota archaeon]
MKIDHVEIIPVNIPTKKVLTLSRYGRLGEGKPFEFVIVRVHTDEGIVGLGECPPLPPLSPESQPVIVAMLKHWIAPNILGLDPFDTGEIWEKMDFYAPTYPMSKAAIDMAIWDIKGKSLKKPLYKLLGGSLLKKFPIVALIGIKKPEEMASEAEKLVSEGFTGLRLKIGPKRDVECVKAVREAVGEEVSIRVDGNQGYSTEQAVNVINKLEKYEIELVEQPTVWWDFKALSKVTASVNTPIMPHESMYLMSDVKTLIDMNAVGVLGLKTYRPGGGVTNTIRILEMARIMDIPCLMHDDVELGISLSTATHIIAAYGKVLTYKSELSGYPEWFEEDVITKPLNIKEGYAEVPEGNGIGVELDELKIKKYSPGIVKV